MTEPDAGMMSNWAEDESKVSAAYINYPLRARK